MCSQRLLKLECGIHVQKYGDREKCETKYTSVRKALSCDMIAEICQKPSYISLHVKADAKITRKISCLLTCEVIDLHSLQTEDKKVDGKT